LTKLSSANNIQHSYIPFQNNTRLPAILLHCSIALELWSMVFTLFGIYWVKPKTVVEFLACWQGKFGSHRNKSTLGL